MLGYNVLIFLTDMEGPMKLVISSVIFTLLATGSVFAQTNSTTAPAETAAPAQEQMAAPADNAGAMAHEKKHKKAHKAAHHAKKKHHKKKKHHTAV